MTISFSFSSEMSTHLSHALKTFSPHTIKSGFLRLPSRNSATVSPDIIA